MKRAIEPILSPKIGVFLLGALSLITEQENLNISVPGILQHETTSDVGVPSGARQQSREMSREAAKKGLDDLLNFVCLLFFSSFPENFWISQFFFS